MARPKGSHDSTPEIRGAFKRATKMLEERKKPLSTIWMEVYEEEGARIFLELAMKAMPKDVSIDHTIEQNVTVNTNQLAGEVLKQVLIQEDDEPTPKELH